MKFHLTVFLIFALAGAVFGQAAQEIDATYSSPSLAWQAKPRNASQTEWARVRLSTNYVTARITTNGTHYIEVGNWLNVQNPETGAWEKSRPEFIATATG